MEALLAALEATPIAQYLRVSRWGYAATNGAHIFGIALLVGSVIPLDLRLLGAWPQVPRETLARVLVPVASIGLALALLTGLLLFGVRAREYAELTIFQVKLTLVLVGGASAIALHVVGGLWLERSSRGQTAIHAALSMICWTGALASGRLIGFAGD